MTVKKFLRGAACAAVFGIIGGISFEGVVRTSDAIFGANRSLEDSQKESKDVDTVDAASTVSVSDGSSNGVSDIAQDVLPSIVAIDVTATETKTDIFGRTYSQDSQGSGSGIIVGKDDKNLYIATNNHVVDDAKSVSIKFNDDGVCRASVKGTDSTSDLAVVEVDLDDISSDTMKNIKVAQLGDSDSIKVGAQAIAIGNALGYGTSVTVGYISAKDREVQGEDENMKLLQTDAAINPGNSGGALVDENGAVIGINSAKYSDTSVEGMGFAIPINAAKPIINSIVKSEAPSEGEAAYLGIRGVDVEAEYAQYYNMPEGIFVSEAEKSAPAGSAGIQKGDIIVKFDKMDVKTMDGLQDKLALHKAGDKVEVTIKRADNGDYVEKTFTVTLGKRADAIDNEDENDGAQAPDEGNGEENVPFYFPN